MERSPSRGPGLISGSVLPAPVIEKTPIQRSERLGKEVTMRRLWVLSLALLAPAALGQASANYSLTENVFDEGGVPESGTVMISPIYRISSASLGEAAVGIGLESGSAFGSGAYGMDSGFVSSFPPPGEVHDLRLPDSDTLVWAPDKSIGFYNLYRDLLTNLAGMGYGSCEQHGITEETTTDPDTPPDTDGFFYLVTAHNRLDEEGTKGSSSAGDQRPNPDPCP